MPQSRGRQGKSKPQGKSKRKITAKARKKQKKSK
jgi:hypothetical protein